MGRRRKLRELEGKLGKKFPYFLCGLLNAYGLDKTAEMLKINPKTLYEYLYRYNIAKMWVILSDPNIEAHVAEIEKAAPEEEV